MHYFLVVVAVFAGLIGFVLLSNATSGVGVICGGCLAAILARVAQAGVHQDELRRDIRAAIEAANKRAPEPSRDAWGEPR